MLDNPTVKICNYRCNTQEPLNFLGTVKQQFSSTLSGIAETPFLLYNDITKKLDFMECKFTFISSIYLINISLLLVEPKAWLGGPDLAVVVGFYSMIGDLSYTIRKQYVKKL